MKRPAQLFDISDYEKEKSMKKIISIVLVCVMLLSAVPVCFADDYTDHFSLSYDPLEYLEFVIEMDCGEEALEQLRQNTDYWGTVNSVFTKEAEDPTPEQIMNLKKHYIDFWLDCVITAACGFHIYVKDEAYAQCVGKDEAETQRNINKFIGLNYPENAQSVYTDSLDVYLRLRMMDEQPNGYAELSLVSSYAFDWAYLHLTPLERYYFIAKMYYYFEKDNEETPKVWVGTSTIYRSGDQPNYGADINLDGDISLSDLKYFKAYLLGSRDIINVIAADRDGDGEITLKDYKKYKYYLMTN